MSHELFQVHSCKVVGTPYFKCNLCGAIGVGQTYVMERDYLLTPDRIRPSPHYLPVDWASYIREGKIIHVCPKCKV